MKRLNIYQTISITFIGIIIIGTVLLSLPFASKAPGSIGLLTALFTSTSAVCVTGLSLVDIWSSYTFFGQLVILILMETGGLGFMSIVSILFYVINHHNGIQSLSLMAQSVGTDGLSNITRIQKRLLIGSVAFEGTGALILFLSLLPSFDPLTALWLGVFHSISSFCNAGFDLMGIISPGCGLTAISDNPLALITVALLIIIGGIGFLVWDDIITAKKLHFFSIYTRYVLITTGILLTLGFIFFFMLEYNNSATMGNMGLGGKIANAFFQSATTRTAGFSSVNQADLTDSSLVLTMLLMFIGGSAGSTAGGIKTVTFLIVIWATFSSATGRRSTTILGRSISQEQINQAYTIVIAFFLLGIIGGFAINLTSGVAFSKSLFESISALATVGLSLGITSGLSVISKLILILYMFIGRVGLLTLTLGFFKKKENSDIKFPAAKILF